MGVHDNDFRSTREWVNDELNKLGEEEWEATAVTGDGYILMKRPKGTRSESDAKRRRPGFTGAGHL
jgi:hypothetical protein